MPIPTFKWDVNVQVMPHIFVHPARGQLLSSDACSAPLYPPHLSPGAPVGDAPKQCAAACHLAASPDCLSNHSGTLPPRRAVNIIAPNNKMMNPCKHTSSVVSRATGRQQSTLGRQSALEGTVCWRAAHTKEINIQSQPRTRGVLHNQCGLQVGGRLAWTGPPTDHCGVAASAPDLTSRVVTSAPATLP